MDEFDRIVTASFTVGELEDLDAVEEELVEAAALDTTDVAPRTSRRPYDWEEGWWGWPDR